MRTPLADLPLSHRLFLAAYRWRRSAPVAAAALRAPLHRCRVALVTTAGLVAPGDAPFDRDVRGGDWSWRTIPADVDPRALTCHQRSDAFDRGPLTADVNVAFPIARLAELAAAGAIGAVAPRHLSFMGSITAPARLTRESAPAAAAQLAADQVDVALLVPV
ncbi:MAG: glycine/sarcosine/betaine reductase selenoprotein B family protein [Vicinamibacterales bacterium]